MIKVSYFSNVNDTIPKDYSLEEWLKMTINPPKNLEDEVLLYRETLSEKHKKKLPCITVSASFGKYRNLDNIKQKNKLICIDVDRYSKSKKRKSNRCVDMLLVKEMFMEHPSTLYTGLSCGGDGVYAILCIDDENDLEGYFEHFLEKLANIGINIDISCKDYTRLRFFSVDREAYFNPNAKYYKKKETPVEATKTTIPKDIPQQTATQTATQTREPRERAIERLDNWGKVKKITEEIERLCIDITSGYDDWVKIGGALYNEFGEDGREVFHRISKFHPDYKFKDCDQKYTNCKKLSRVSFNSFFYVASSYGIRY